MADGADFTRVLSQLKDKGISVERIYFSGSEQVVDAEHSSLQSALETGVYPLLYLCQAVVAGKPKKPVQVFYGYQGTEEIQPHHEAVGGFFGTVQAENSKFDCKVIEFKNENQSAEVKLSQLMLEFGQEKKNDIFVRYQYDIRSMRKLSEFALEGTNDSDSTGGLKEQGVYLITGGAGGLGLIFAEHLARQCQARLVLTGRSAANEALEAKLENLRSLGAEVLYLAADVSKEADVQNLVQQSREHFRRGQRGYPQRRCIERCLS